MDEPGKWIRRYAPGEDAPVRLICFPHAGGSASFFHPVAMAFSPGTDVVALQYPGRQDRRREPTIDNITEYADRLTAVVRTLPPRPTVYFGHSMGAILAFEVIRRLEAAGDRGPRSLIASGRRGPATPRTETVHQRDDDGILREMRELNGTDSTLLMDEEILRMAMPSMRGDYTAIETYTCPPDAVVTAPVTVLTGDNDPKTTVEEARAWEAHTTGGCRLRVFGGGHFFLTAHIPEVNAEIRDELDRVGRSTAPAE